MEQNIAAQQGTAQRRTVRRWLGELVHDVNVGLDALTRIQFEQPWRHDGAAVRSAEERAERARSH